MDLFHESGKNGRSLIGWHIVFMPSMLVDALDGCVRNDSICMDAVKSQLRDRTSQSAYDIRKLV